MSRRLGIILGLTLALLALAMVVWAVTASDDFNRAAPLGANWSTNQGGMTICTNALCGNGASDNQVFYNAISPGAAQFAELTLTAEANGQFLGPGVRHGGAGVASAYQCITDGVSNNEISEFVAGTYTQLASNTTNLAVNDVVRLEASGSSLTCKRNGANLLTATDSSLVSGSVGAGGFDMGATRMDNWSGGDLAAQPPTRRRIYWSWRAKEIVREVGEWWRSSGSVHAQATFSRLYLVPVEGSGASRVDARRMKYRADFCAVSCAMMPFGAEPFALVVAKMDTLRDAAVQLNADVLALPLNLDQNLTTLQVTATQTRLEAVNIPAGWLSTTFTWRAALRIIAGLFQFAQRLRGIRPGVRIFGATVTLDTRWNRLPLGVQTDITDAALSLGFSTTTLTGNLTVRQLLREMATKWDVRPLELNGLII
jgi:hypothetical protein